MNKILFALGGLLAMMIGCAVALIRILLGY